MQIRNFKPSDYSLICSWFEDAKHARFPEESSFVLEVENKPKVCVSVFLTNTDFVFCENLIADPEFKDRKQATQKIMEHAWSFAKEKGYKYAAGFTVHEKLAQRHLEMGWDKKTNSIIVSKVL